MFVLVYSSYHLNLTFPHLVVILTTLETQRTSSVNNNIMNDITLNKTVPGLIILYSQNYAAGICGHYHKSSDFFEYPPPPPPKKKNLLKSPLKSSHTKNTQKNTGVENFKPKRNLRSSISLEIQSALWV